MMKDNIITFGSFSWRVLDNKDDMALIITEDIIELRWYHKEFVDITWADCELRKHLNNEFYQTFSQEEKTRIITVENSNPDNPWFKTKGGIDTTDNIFLLSLEEICNYSGSSEHLLNKGGQKWQIEDDNNVIRQAKFGKDYHWWRLRSPGYYGRTAASVSSNGNVYVRGNGVYGRPRDGGGVRPALWLKK